MAHESVTTGQSKTEKDSLGPCFKLRVFLGPVRTSPTAPKVPTPQKQINVAAPRRTPQVTRNGGDAELVELNQQVPALRPVRKQNKNHC